MSKEVTDLFNKYIELSDSIRQGYKNSLGKWDNKILPNIIPNSLDPIYSIVQGTRYEIENQSLMDFLPGHLLIHIDEYSHFKQQINSILDESDKKEYFPLLVNYSSDFYAIRVNDNNEELGIYLISHDEPEPIKIHDSLALFLETLIICYEEGAYFIDEDGYLDVDFEKEELIGQKLNPKNEYWFEE